MEMLCIFNLWLHWNIHLQKKKIISSILKIDAMYVYILCPIKKKNEIGMLQ